MPFWFHKIANLPPLTKLTHTEARAGTHAYSNNITSINDVLIVCCDLVELEMIDKDPCYQTQIFLLPSSKSPEKDSKIKSS
ncbi:hypothetical protein Hanom_Chr11g00993351 [Helianthus anomalus]